MTRTPSEPAARAPIDELPRVLGPVAAFCVVVGAVIGSGIFIVPASVATNVPYLGGIIGVWVVGGLFSLAGALTLAELGAMLPAAGGPYVYLREAYGRLSAFLFGWTEFLVVRAGSMATLAAAFARYFGQVFEPPEGVDPAAWQMIAAVGAIALVTTVNVLGTALGGWVQVIGTALKVGALLALILLPMVVGGADPARLSPAWPGSIDADLARGFMTAMVGVLWAYDGWVNLTPLAEEVRQPERNIPRALMLGMAVLIALYLAATLAYHLVLPLAEVASPSGNPSNRAVAADYCRRLVGPNGGFIISMVVMASTLISLNGNALAGPRAYFAMARDGLFPAGLCRVHSRFRTPANAVFVQSAWATALTVVGTILILYPPPTGLPGPISAVWAKLNATPLYDLLYTYVIFGATIFYMLAIASVFTLRRTRPDLPRPYRTWGYPITPALYVAASLLLLGNMLVASPVESLAGLAIIALGLPAYLVYSRRPAPVP